MNRVYVLVGLAIAVVAAVALFLMQEKSGGESSPAAEKAVPVAEMPKEAAPKQAPAVSNDIKPSFDIVRIEPDGSSVLAGRAAPGSKVRVMNGDRLVGEAETNDRGEWTMLPKEPLPPGDTELRIFSKLSDGKEQESEHVVILKVPEKGSDNGALAVVVARGGEGRSKVLQRPKPGPGVNSGDLRLDIIDYDDQGRLTLAGRGKPGAKLHIYTDEKSFGGADIDANGDWHTQPDSLLEPGSYRLRLDQIENEKVTARIEVPFTRSPPVETLKGENFVVVQPGNNLWLIARRELGTGFRYTVIFDANKDQIKDPDLIYPGQIFAIPEASGKDGKAP